MYRELAFWILVFAFWGLYCFSTRGQRHRVAAEVISFVAACGAASIIWRVWGLGHVLPRVW